MRPLVWVGIAAGLSAVIRFAVALQVRAPVFYPDEYLSTDLGRGIIRGTLGGLRGESLSNVYPSYFAPLVQSPLWLLDDIDLSVRLAQALGTIAFASAAFPAYALARRLAISQRGSLAVAVLTLVAPAGAFTGTLLAEPYAYLFFLVAVLAAVDAIARPTPVRQLAALLALAGLCFVGGLQFVYAVPAYAVAWVLTAWPSKLSVLRRLAVLAGASAVAFALVLAAGQGHYVDALVGAARYQSYPLVTLGSWAVVNAFVLAVAAGWVLVPGAVLGLYAMLRDADPARRAFVHLTMWLLAAMLVEAAVWGANGNGVYERFTFYGAPLLAVAFVWAVERTTPRRAVYAALAYLAALAAVVLPVTEPLFAALDHHSPSINGLSELTFGSDIGGGIWGPALAALAVGAAWRGPRSPRAVLVVAAGVCIFAGAGESHVLVRVTEDRRFPPHVPAAADSAMLTWPGASSYLLLDTLFWNPEITRVAVVGRGLAPDGLPSISSQLVSPGRLLSADGSAVAGPFVIGPDVVVGGSSVAYREHGRFAILDAVPPLLGFGFRRQTGDMDSSARFFAAAGERPRTVIVRLRSPTRVKTVGVTCPTWLEPLRWHLTVGPTPISLAVPVPAHSMRFCHVHLIRGGIDTMDGRRVSVEASLTLRPSSSRAVVGAQARNR